jgi:hypothetical protein
MAMTNVTDEEPFSARDWQQIFLVWCEANPEMVNSTVHQAGQRLKALEELWRESKAVFASKLGYDKAMRVAVKAMNRADKSLLAGSNETGEMPHHVRL